MNIIHPGAKMKESPEQAGRLVRLPKEEAVPFVPAYDLLEKQERQLTSEDIAAIGLSLWVLLEELEQKSSNWQTQARAESISKRL